MAIFHPYAFMGGAPAPTATPIPPTPTPEPAGIVTTGLWHWWTALDTNSYPGTGTVVTDLGTQGLNILKSATNVSFTTLGGANTFYKDNAATGNGQLGAVINPSYTMEVAKAAEAWIYPNASQGGTNAYLPVISWCNTVSSGVFMYFNQNSNAVAVYDFTLPSARQWRTAGTNNITRGQWNHVMATWTSSSITVYVNGSLITTFSGIAPQSRVLSGQYSNFTDGEPTRKFDGGISVIRHYNNYTPTSDDVLQNFNVEKAIFGL